MANTKISQAAKLLNRKSRKGQKARWAGMTKEERSETMRQVALARYAKDKGATTAGATPQAAPAVQQAQS